MQTHQLLRLCCAPCSACAACMQANTAHDVQMSHIEVGWGGERGMSGCLRAVGAHAACARGCSRALLTTPHTQIATAIMPTNMYMGIAHDCDATWYTCCMPAHATCPCFPNLYLCSVHFPHVRLHFCSGYCARCILLLYFCLYIFMLTHARAQVTTTQQPHPWVSSLEHLWVAELRCFFCCS
jgi:hypothetical protein